jgi:hypothetical protein
MAHPAHQGWDAPAPSAAGSQQQRGRREWNSSQRNLQNESRRKGNNPPLPRPGEPEAPLLAIAPSKTGVNDWPASAPHSSPVAPRFQGKTRIASSGPPDQDRPVAIPLQAGRRISECPCHLAPTPDPSMSTTAFPTPTTVGRDTGHPPHSRPSASIMPAPAGDPRYRLPSGHRPPSGPNSADRRCGTAGRRRPSARGMGWLGRATPSRAATTPRAIIGPSRRSASPLRRR